MPLPGGALPQPQQNPGPTLGDTEILGRPGNAGGSEGAPALGVSPVCLHSSLRPGRAGRLLGEAGFRFLISPKS